MYLLRVKMAAMGIVDDNVDANSGLSPDLATGGSWYGTTVGFAPQSALSLSKLSVISISHREWPPFPSSTNYTI